MFFKRPGFFLFLLMLLGVTSPTWGQLQQSECIRDMQKYGPQLFKNTLATSQSKRFFACLHDAVEVVALYLIPEPGRDYYTKQELIDILITYKFPAETSHSIMKKFFAFKKLFVGGKDNQLSVQEVHWIYNLMDEFEQVISFLQRDFPLIVRAFSGKGMIHRELSEKEFQGLSRRLSSSFSLLRKAFIKEGFFYRLGDLHKTSDYLHHVGLITNENRKMGKRFSVFLHEWGNGVFGSNALIKGNRWEPFFGSFHALLSQFLYYGLYVAGKDLSQPQVFARFLKSAQFFLSSLEYVRAHPSGTKGFPLKGLDRMFQVMTETLQDQSALSSSGSLLQSLMREGGSPWILLSRALTCFSLPPRKAGCEVRWGDSSTPQVVSYHFPDGEFHFYENRQEWRPATKRTFEIHPDQIRYLKSWVSYWSYNFLSFDDGELPAYQGQQAALSGWINGFFGQDLTGRIVFDRHNSQPSIRRLSRSFMENDLFIKLFFSSYPSQKQPLPSVNFRNSSFHLSPALWEQAVEELSPVFTFLYRNGFSPRLKKSFISLLDYADYFLNTANRNGSLDYGELMDLALHLSSAAVSSKKAYDYILRDCAPPMEASCVSQELFATKEVLDHIPYLQSYLSNSSERFDEITQKLLPEQITGFEDLMVFFLFVQMIETNFYFLDKDRSFYVETEEIFPLMRALAPKVWDAVPFIHSEKPALAFLIYSAYNQTIPCVHKDSKRSFQCLEFVNWVSYTDKWRGLKLSRTHIFSLAVDFYNFYSR